MKNPRDILVKPIVSERTVAKWKKINILLRLTRRLTRLK